MTPFRAIPEERPVQHTFLMALVVPETLPAAFFSSALAFTLA